MNRLFLRLALCCLLHLVGWETLFSQQAAYEPIDEMLAAIAEQDFNELSHDTTGLAALRPPQVDCDGFEPSDFMVVDWDGAGNRGLLYDAPCNPYAEVVWYAQKNGEWEVVHQMPGVLVQWQRDQDGWRGLVWQEAIGCITTSSLVGLRWDMQGRLMAQHRVEWPSDLEGKFSFPAKPVSCQGYLRTHPVTYDVPYKSDCDELRLGNQCDYLAQATEARLMETRGNWRLVAARKSGNNWTVGWANANLSDMEENKSTITRFYEAFQKKDYRTMGACYAPNATFKDEVFDLKNGKEAAAMWHMLCENGKDLRIEFGQVQADSTSGTAHWDAYYTFSATGRKVINRIDARFEFQNGKIVMHHDKFRFWRWSRQALGGAGLFLGWTPLLRKKVQATAMKSLRKFIADHPEYQ